MEGLNDIIEELENWHEVRSKINEKPVRRGQLVMETLPKAIKHLKDYRDLLKVK